MVIIISLLLVQITYYSFYFVISHGITKGSSETLSLSLVLHSTNFDGDYLYFKIFTN